MSGLRCAVRPTSHARGAAPPIPNTPMAPAHKVFVFSEARLRETERCWWGVLKAIQSNLVVGADTAAEFCAAGTIEAVGIGGASYLTSVQ